jgi:Dyp-type peroxidase family
MQHPEMQKELGDESKKWEPGFQNEIHALVLLAADRIVGPRTKEAKLQEQKDQRKLRQQPVLLAQKVEKIKQELAAIASVVHEEIGYVLRDATSGEEIEHFGFRDGVSQPLFLKRDIDKERGKKEHFDKWDPRAPLNLVLFKDPLGKNKESYGSFLVFRKLEQNVPGWEDDVVENLAKKLEIDPLKNDGLAGAYTMGRFQDGTVVVQSSKKDPKFKGNDFNYSQDPQGTHCPFFAHARKVNPRGDTTNPSLVSPPALLEEEKMHRIARRAINYGPLPSDRPETGAGLLFMCFQASLTNQFNFMQGQWAKGKDFVKPDVGTDVVIGVEKKDAQDEAIKEQYNWPTKWGESEQTKLDFSHWVTMKGGEFFFAPSMSFLRDCGIEPSRNIVFRGAPKKEIEAAKMKIVELQRSKEKKWAIGLDGATTEPDGFLTFFNQRKLPFEFYVQNPQVELGGSEAYDNNIATLNKYIEDVITQEVDACEYKIAELEEYKNLNWAIGLNGDDPKKTDGFLNFFGERELAFVFYVQSKNVSLGDRSAYDKNITALKNYIKGL